MRCGLLRLPPLETWINLYDIEKHEERCLSAHSVHDVLHVIIVGGIHNTVRDSAHDEAHKR